MGRYQAYPEYKDSGVEWLGQVPSEWIMSKVVWNFKAEKGKSGQILTKEYCGEYAGDYPVYSGQTENEGVMGRINSFEFDKGAEGVLFSTTVGAKAMHLSHLKGKFSLSQNCMIISAISKNVDTRFAFYHFHPLFAFERSLIPEHMQASFRMEDLYSYPICLPSLKEQKAIANFLDHETAKIDTLIEQQQQLIQLLKEKRQAVISHAVTKGLNPDAPMKDSGVEWLGEVPAHWDVMPIKYACELIKDGTHLPPPRVADGIPLLSVRNIVDGHFVFRDDDSNISVAAYEALCKSFIPMENDVVLAIVGATLGKVAQIAKMSQFHVQRSVAIFRTKQEKLLPTTLRNIFDSSGFQSLLWEYVGFSAQPGIYLGTLENFQIPVPPKEEQDLINSYCQEQSSSIDLLIKHGQKAVNLMQERRTALISAAVTGKIDVRNWQAPNN